MFKHRLRMIGHVATRAFIALVVAVVVASGLALLSAEAVVAWYMQQYGKRPANPS